MEKEWLHQNVMGGWSWLLYCDMYGNEHVAGAYRELSVPLGDCHEARTMTGDETQNRWTQLRLVAT
jgi:hypothetical protein